MKTGLQIRVKNTQEIGVILEINEDFVKVYIPERGTFWYFKSNLEIVDRLPVSDYMENSQ
jgi:hypothetical protein